MLKKYAIFVLSLGLSLGLNLYFRSFPVNFPQLKKEARNLVDQRILGQSREEINKGFPDFSALAKNNLADTLSLDYKRQKKDAVARLIKEEYARLKGGFQDDKGQTYLMELDGWHWARYVENICLLGHPGDEVTGARQKDNLMLAPSGNFLLWDNFLLYLSAYLYKAFSFFVKGVPLLTFLFYLPLVFIGIFTIVLYLFCFFRWGNAAALIACLFVGLSPVFIPRSCAGWFDTDVLALLFPLLVIWPYLAAFEPGRFRRRFGLVVLSALCTGLFSFTWIYWWFIFLILIVYELYSLLNMTCVYWQYKERDGQLLRIHLVFLFVFTSLSLAFLLLFSGTLPLKLLYMQLRQALVLNEPLVGSVWPNVYLTVAELKKTDFLYLARSAGGVFVFLASLGCLLALFLRTARNPKYSRFERELIVVLAFWFLSMFFACFKGARFAVFLSLPLGISLGWGVKEAYAYLKSRDKRWAWVFALLVTAGLSFSFLNNSAHAARALFPLMNDHWYRALNKIKETTPKEAVINSWWDFGDWFSAVARRKVIFDGQSQNKPQAYWMAYALMSENEAEAVRILRMLNNSGNQAFELINGGIKDPFKSVLLLKKVIALDKKAARETLARYLPVGQVEKVMGFFSARPAKAYFLVDYTMQDKANAVSFIGNWDFVRAYVAQNRRKLSRARMIDQLKGLDLDAQKAERLYEESSLIPAQDLERWVSAQARFYGRAVKGEERSGSVLFNNGMVYKPKGHSVYLYSPAEGTYRIPKSLFYLKQDKLEEVALPGANLDFSVLIIKSKEGYEAVLLDRALARSMLVRLYFLNGRGLKYFKSFLEERDGDNYIRVFEILWD